MKVLTIAVIGVGISVGVAVLAIGVFDAITATHDYLHLLENFTQPHGH